VIYFIDNKYFNTANSTEFLRDQTRQEWQTNHFYSRT